MACTRQWWHSSLSHRTATCSSSPANLPVVHVILFTFLHPSSIASHAVHPDFHNCCPLCLVHEIVRPVSRKDLLARKQNNSTYQTPCTPLQNTAGLLRFTTNFSLSDLVTPPPTHNLPHAHIPNHALHLHFILMSTCRFPTYSSSSIHQEVPRRGFLSSMGIKDANGLP